MSAFVFGVILSRVSNSPNFPPTSISARASLINLEYFGSEAYRFSISKKKLCSVSDKIVDLTGRLETTNPDDF